MGIEKNEWGFEYGLETVRNVIIDKKWEPC